jgi:hypothetical protein
MKPCSYKRLLRHKVRDLKQGHRTGPEDNQTSMGDVSTQQLTGQIDQDVRYQTTRQNLTIAGRAR